MTRDIPIRIVVVTGSRAEYGILYWLLHDLRADRDFDLQLVVTGSHLSKAHGMTVVEIERDGFEIAARVELPLDDDSALGTMRALSAATAGCAEVFDRVAPDLVFVFGDRYEILGAAQAAALMRIPLAHASGGDTTEGAFDESIRHALTKLSHLHFPTNGDAAARIRQMGEEPARVHLVGNPGLDHVTRTEFVGRAELEDSLGASLGERNLLVTFHPVTNESDRGLSQLIELLAALDSEPAETRIWLTGSNADPGYDSIERNLKEFLVSHHVQAVYHKSLGQQRYLGLMHYVDAVVGNSSSGLCEAPTFGAWTVDVGNRQAGRLAGNTVIHVEPDRDAIRAALARTRSPIPDAAENPYGDGRSSGRILEVLRDLPSRESLIVKRFHELGRA